ncbi:unnamed protein product [Paramecium sonneborni]|uniref:RING-type domain-containing protein n=1 Tax=Paramecium sonneborni TaxID=65129 RepID=A0A8S1Q5J0_9CILI|nr:unnamed protein product [Paramecium sonneborni]
MNNSSRIKNSHQSNDCWAALFCGIIEVLIKTNQHEQISLLKPYPNQYQLSRIRIFKTIELMNQIIRNPNTDLFYSLINQEEASQVMKIFIKTQYNMMTTQICNKEILELLSNNFKIDIIFITQNTSISLSNSENLELILKIVQQQSEFIIETSKKSRSRSSSLLDYVLEMKQECNGCQRIFEQGELQKSLSCNHTYCKLCLKFYFKLGQSFICKDFFCKMELKREDFPFLQFSPLMDTTMQQNKCLQCKESINKLYINKCGHTHCQKCIKDQLNKSKLFQTNFCLEPSCTELLSNDFTIDQSTNNNDYQSVLSRQNSIIQKNTEFCYFCQSDQEKGVKGECGHYYCKICLDSKYQQIITYGLNRNIDCPFCQQTFNIEKILDEYYNQLLQVQNPRLKRMRSNSEQYQTEHQQTQFNKPSFENQQHNQFNVKALPQLNQINQSPFRISSAVSTPKRVINSACSDRVNHNYPKQTQYLQRNPQFF